MKNKPMLIRLLYFGIATLISDGCATAAGTHPDDMSVAEHQTAARLNEKIASEEEAKFDPDATAVRPPPENYEEEFFPETVYNPTEKHLLHAKKYRDYARQHKEAAQQLEEFEEEECAAFPKSTRVKCPLIGNVERIEDIEGGVRLNFFGNSPPINAVAAHMRCHYAFGRKIGREGMPDCPLYLKNLEIRISGDRAIDIISSDTAVVEKIRKRSRNHIGK